MMTAEPTAPARRSAGQALTQDLRAVLPAWLAARVLVGFAYLLAVAVMDHWVPGGTTHQARTGLLAWDGAFYRDLAELGYQGTRTEAVRFFPLYPGAGKAVGVLLFGRVDLALVLVANLASLGAAVALRRLVLFERDDRELADRTAWVLAFFPSAFVLVWGYAEGLFLVLAIGTVLAARRGRWEVAAACGLAAALCRPLGVLLAAAVAVEALRGWRSATMGDRLRGALAVVAPGIGLLAFVAWVGNRYGDPFLPFTIQSEFRGETDPISRFVRGLGDMFGPERFGDGLHIPFFIAFVALAVLVARRWPASYTAYTVLCLVAAVSADNLNSLERYGLNAFPLVLALAEVASTKRREWWGLAVCGNGVVALAALAWMAIYVP